MAQVMEQLSPGIVETDKRSGGTSLLFVRSGSGAILEGVSSSVSAVGAPTELHKIAHDIVTEFGDALDRLGE